MIALFTAPPPSTVAQRRQHNAHGGFEHGGEVTVCGRGGWKFAKWLAAVVAGVGGRRIRLKRVTGGRQGAMRLFRVYGAGL